MSSVRFTSNFRNDTDAYPLATQTSINTGTLTATNSVSANTFITTYPSGFLDLSGITLSPSSGSVAGQHIQVRINGVNYKIELKNP